MWKMTSNEIYQGLYVHIPFCLRKCDYCDFYSVPVNDTDIFTRYVKCVAREGQLLQDNVNLPMSAVYLGGGTPSLLPQPDLSFLLEHLQKSFQLNHNIEISMEANPVRHDSNYFRAVKEIGINRLSLGVQSFNDEELHTLNRIHSSRDALATVEVLHKVGLTNFNLDLIYGIPGQNMNTWKRTLKTALSCHPAHISIYLLQLNPVTPMAEKIKCHQLELLGDETEAAMYYYALDVLKSAGYCHYEISNLARPGYECRHNMIYWKARPYTGLGAGAVSFRNGRRILNTANVEQYMQNIEAARLPSTELLEEMEPSDLPGDAVILGLRLIAGVNAIEFRQRYGIDINEVYHEPITHGINNGLLKYTREGIALTEKGYFLSNQVLCEFVK
ncbi:MAG TPA: radical SAM family heme chaperone HemW [Syntrophomonadaceae bacterium]|nr:radical SAM family heme chaperone HemW [Syntrophomonadaceae bacterium]